MKHSRFHENQRPSADAELFSISHRPVIPFLEIVARVIFMPHFGAEKRLVFSDPVHQARQSAGVIHLGMVANNVINPCEDR